MSQYLNFYLKNKETKISLGYFCTTIAREIASLGAFPYTECEVLLDNIEPHLSLIKKERDEYKEHLEKLLCEKSETKGNIYKCLSVEVVQMLLERIADLELSISDSKETIDRWEYIINRISFIFDIWEENQKEWQLYYTNC